MLAIARAKVHFVLDLLDWVAIGVLWKVNQIAAISYATYAGTKLGRKGGG